MVLLEVQVGDILIADEGGGYGLASEEHGSIRAFGFAVMALLVGEDGEVGKAIDGGAVVHGMQSHFTG